MKIDQPGIYRNIDVKDYFDDPCPEPSLSQSIAKVLIDRSPLHAFAEHPRLTPPAEAEEEAEKYVKAKVVGDAAHMLMIGRGKNLAVAPFDSWMTKAAQMFRDSAAADGKTPILECHLQDADKIVRAAERQLAQHEERDCFEDGAGEVALIWQEGPIWFRCLVDWLPDHLLGADDYKTTGMSVAPHVLGIRAADAGWDIQAAMIERGLRALDPSGWSRPLRIRFIAQEQAPPYALNVMVMDEAWLTMGRKKLQAAVDIWTRCTTRGQWPGYPPVAITPEYPGWKEAQWLDREIRREIEEGARGEMLTSLAGG